MHDEPKKRIYAYDPPSIRFDFAQTPESFSVEELPLTLPSGKGAWLYLQIRKRGMSTLKLLSTLKSVTGATDREIGYAGLKDRNATTLQWISLPRRYEKELRHLSTPRVEILRTARHSAPLKTGMLRGNRFKVILKNISHADAPRLQSLLGRIEREGFPNYFGYQRFGNEGTSWMQGRSIARSGKRLKGSKERLLVAAWQSRLFNDWLAHRLALSKVVASFPPNEAAERLSWPKELIQRLHRQPALFKLFLGDLMQPPGNGRLAPLRSMQKDAAAFARGEILPTGLLSGAKAPRAGQDARHLEEPFDDRELHSLPGARRAAWVFPRELQSRYDAKERTLTLEFTLPPGSYATTLIEELAGEEFRMQGGAWSLRSGLGKAR